MSPQKRHRFYYEGGKKIRRTGELALTTGAVAGLGYGGARYLASGGRYGGKIAHGSMNELLGPLSRGTKWIGRKIFGKRVSRATAGLVGRHPGLRSAAIGAVRAGRRLRLSRIAPRAIRYGGWAALGGGALQAYGWLRGGSPKRKERAKASLLRAALYNADDIARGVGAVGGISA